jgi:small subunit ribosomal protein S9
MSAATAKATQERWYATGKRKEAVARVWLTPGSGRILVNRREVDEFFRRPTLKMLVEQPFDVTETRGRFDVLARVAGGGLSGQAGALRHGIARALLRVSTDLRGPLKRAGFLTRDARIVERKKYGQAGARKRFQYSKR